MVPVLLVFTLLSAITVDVHTKLLFPHPERSTSTDHNLAHTQQGTHSRHLGPAVSEAGVTFRVWAPHASSADVEPQSSTQWQKTSMQKDTSGYWTATIASAKPGDSYVYMFDGHLRRLDPVGQGINDQKNASVVHNPAFDWGNSADFQPPPVNKAIVYELHVYSFSAEGTLDGASKKLPYLASLGINVVELMPIFEAQPRDSGWPHGWGYDANLQYAVQNNFGGYMALKRFVKAANAVGIAVWLDVVWNHLVGDNYLEDFDGFSGGYNGIYFFTDPNNANTDWGPRPNYGDKDVLKYLLNWFTTFTNDYHISGYRWDSTICIRKGTRTCWNHGTPTITSGWNFMRSANNLLHGSGEQITEVETILEERKDPHGLLEVIEEIKITREQFQSKGVLTVAEDLQNDFSITKPTSQGGAGFDGQWCSTFYYNLWDQLTLGDNSNVDMKKVANTLINEDGEDTNRVIYLEDHDKASTQQNGRIAAKVDPGGNPHDPSWWALKKSAAAIGAVLTAPGIPMLFMGEEFVSYTAFKYPVPHKLDWSLAQSNKGITKMVSDLAALRANKKGNSGSLAVHGKKNGKLLLLSNDKKDKVALLYRYSGSSVGDCIVIFNMYNTSYSNYVMRNVPKSGTWNVVFNGDNKEYSPKFGNFGVQQKTVHVNNGVGSVMVPPYSMVILAL